MAAPISRVSLGALFGVLAVTVASICLVLTSPPATLRERALDDARQAFVYLRPSKECAGRCTVRPLRQVAPGTWRVRLQTGDWSRCFLVTPAKFAYVSGGRGVVGLRAVACR
jgi:hypothetical protein